MPYLYRKHSGSSIKEVIIVLGIITIILAFIIYRAMDESSHYRIVKAKDDIIKIHNALEQYRIDNGFYPTENQGLVALVLPPTIRPIPDNWRPTGYLDFLPTDPWGRSYEYNNPGIYNRNGIDVFTYGEDGTPGGEGNNATIGNWNIKR